jgi:adenosylhomocysteine nucleosidase
MKLLFVAADCMEFGGLLAHVTAVTPANLGLDWSRTASLNGNEAMLIANGVGTQRAAVATRTAIEAFEPGAVISTGFCGALSPLLEVAGLVSADRVLTASGTYPACVMKGAAAGGIRSIPHIARTAIEKRQLASEGAIAVEMEAGGVAMEAARRSLPFYCVRAVTDLAGETLANDFNMALRPDGHFDTMFILRVALLHPATRLPELIRLRKRCIRAARALGDFFANSRF